MERDTTERHPPARTELARTVGDTARRLLGHPFYRGLADGSLPDTALAHFLQQDHWHVLPAYAAAHARCAAVAADPRQALLFSRMGTGTAEDAERRQERVRRWGKDLRLPLADGTPEPLPTTLGYTAFLAAAPARSLPAGTGAVLPAAWLFLLVTDGLLTRRVPGSRYAAVIEEWHPGDTYRGLVDVFLATVDDIAKDCSPTGRRELVTHARHAAYFEWAHVDAAWRREAWPF
ncbi:TenA family protein [Streptomyces sp. URMC 126]|uniref:TenA family protein n=1 Tax=Streptomyces sp. URMC 126 TaxID=3423401 RepID=UPI003F1DD9C6